MQTRELTLYALPIAFSNANTLGESELLTCDLSVTPEDTLTTFTCSKTELHA